MPQFIPRLRKIDLELKFWYNINVKRHEQQINYFLI
nr:MAG TPA: hypothetical protein [Caudoviricetes sp.]